MVAEINLLPKKQRKTLSNKTTILVMALIFLVVALLFTYMYITAKQQRTAADVELGQLQADIAVLQSEVDSSTTQDKGSRSSAVAFTENVSYPVSPIILEVDTFIPLHTYLRQYEFAEQTVTLHADFEDKTMIAVFLSDLLTSKMFTDVKVDEITSFEPVNDASMEGMIDFQKLPRYSAQFTLEIDTVYLRTEGVTK